MIVLGYSFFDDGSDAHKAGADLRDRMLFSLCSIRNPGILRTTDGKPYLTDRPDISFSISHTADLAVCALSFPGTAPSGEWTVMDPSDYAPVVGADAEVLRPADQAERLWKIARRFFHEESLRRLEHREASEIPRIFAEEWTRCESFVKMTGQGFGRGFSELCFDGICSPVTVLSRGEREYVIRLAWREKAKKEENSHG